MTLHLTQSFTLPWAPTAKGRPRTAVRGGRVIIYTPSVTRNAEARIRMCLMEHKLHFYPRGVPVSMHVVFGLPRPNDAPKREQYPPRRPDLANYLMLLCDAGTGVLWEDDSQVVIIDARKELVGAPRIMLTLGVPMDENVAPHMWMGFERTVKLIERDHA